MTKLLTIASTHLYDFILNYNQSFYLTIKYKCDPLTWFTYVHLPLCGERMFPVEYNTHDCTKKEKYGAPFEAINIHYDYGYIEAKLRNTEEFIYIPLKSTPYLKETQMLENQR